MSLSDKGSTASSSPKRCGKVETSNSVQAPSLVSLPPRKGLKSMTHDPTTQPLFRCFDWMVNSTPLPSRQTVTVERSKLSFPVSYLRTRVLGEEIEEDGAFQRSAILPSSLSSTRTTPPLPPSSSSSTTSSITQSPNFKVFDTKASSSFPTERRSSVESNFSTISTISSSSSSSRTQSFPRNGVVERQWWKIDSVSVVKEKKLEEDQSNWKVIAW